MSTHIAEALGRKKPLSLAARVGLSDFTDPRLRIQQVAGAITLTSSTEIACSAHGIAFSVQWIMCAPSGVL